MENNLRQRILSTLVLAPLALAAVHCGGWIYVALITLCVTLGFYEWVRLVDPAARRPVMVLGCGMLLLLMAAGATAGAAFGAMFAVLFVLILFLAAARDHDDRAGLISLGIPYMGGSGLAMLYLRARPDIGEGLAYYLLAVVWGTDIGAYLFGRLIGGPKLAPAISPSKTWAGLCGGVALAAVAGYAVSFGFRAHDYVVAVLLAAVMAAMAQLGDLFESSIKRRSGVKESGGLIPGHGGVLDRIDGLVFAALFFVLFQMALGTRLQWW